MTQDCKESWMDEDTISKESGAPPSPQWKRRVATILSGITLLILLFGVIILDLLNAKKPRVKVLSATVDVRGSLPRADVVLEFDAKTRFSKVTPSSALCTLPSGDVSVSSTTDHNGNIILGLSCLVEDVESHATFLWQVLVEGNTTMAELADVQCEAMIHVQLGYLIPYTHTTVVDAQDFEHKKQRDGHPKATHQTENEPLLSVQRMTPWTLELGIRYLAHIPGAIFDAVPHWQVMLPPFLVKTSRQELFHSANSRITSTIWTPPVNVTLPPSASSEDDVVVFQLGCQTQYPDDKKEFYGDSYVCPWYRPFWDWTDGDSGTNSTTIDILVDSGNSFLETFLGRVHTVFIHHQPQAQELRRRLFTDADQPLPPFSRAAADCVEAADDSFAFDMMLCWTVDSEGVAAVGNLTFYETTYVGVADAHWSDDSDTNTFTIRSRAEVDVQKYQEVDSKGINLIGSATLKYDIDDIVAVVNWVNRGSWWPFTLALEWNGFYSSSKDILSMTLEQGDIAWKENSLLEDAQGSLSLDVENFLLSASMRDQSLDFFAEADFSDVSRQFTIETFAQRNRVDTWKLNAEGRVYDGSWDPATDSTPTHFDMIVTEVVSNIAMNANFILEYAYVEDTYLWLDPLVDYSNISIDSFVIRKGSTFYVKSEANLLIDYVEKSVKFQWEDSGHIDLATYVTASWSSQDDFALVTVDEPVVTDLAGTNLYIDITPTSSVRVSERVGFVQISSKLTAEFDLTLDSNYEVDDFDDSFSVNVNRLFLANDDKPFTEATGEFLLNGERTGTQLILADPNYLGYDIMVDVSWHVGDGFDDWTVNLDNLEIQSGSGKMVDSTAAMSGRRIQGNPVFDVEMTSSQDSDFQVEMGMNVTWKEVEEALVIVLDHFDMTWKGEGLFAPRPLPPGEEPSKREDNDSIIPIFTIVTIITGGVLLLCLLWFILRRQRTRQPTRSPSTPSAPNEQDLHHPSKPLEKLSPVPVPLLYPTEEAISGPATQALSNMENDKISQ